MVFSASAIRALSFASTSLRRASAAAAAFAARLVGERLRPRARFRQRLLVRCNRGIRCVLEALRLGKIVFDMLAARLEDRADARQRDPRHQEIERNEDERQPQQLRGEGLGIERRKPAAVLARRNLDGSDWLCTTLGHSCLHGLCRGRLARSGPVLVSEGNSSSSAISSEKMPSASVTAKPKIKLANWPWRGRRVADRRGQIVAEDGADADAGATHADAGNTSTNLFCGRGSMRKLLSRVV